MQPEVGPHCPDGACVADTASAGSFWPLDTSPFPPRWQCGSWDAWLGWLHIASDVATGVAYTAIPLLLLVVLRRRRGDVPMRPLLLLFTAFILACGAGHLLEAGMFWWPVYRLSGMVKLATALVSVVTVVCLWRALPALLELRSARDLERDVEVRTAELHASELELIEARKLAEDANLAKSRFLAAMSHELRTPLAAILGNLELLADDHALGRVERDERLMSVRRNAEHQLAVIEDVLELSRIESDAIELHRRPTCPVQTVREAIDLVGVRAATRGLVITLDAAGAGHVLETDPVRLRQIVINLLANSIKFTERGGISVEVRTHERNGAVRADVVVRDTGIGMTPEQLGRVFAPYRQAEASTHVRYGGTGLGLVISRKLAEGLGGSLDATSNEGEGSAFTLVVRGPCAHPESASGLPAKATAQLDGLRVLLAEDQADLALVTRRQLELAGCTVVHAADGRAALDAFAAGEFDLVLLDLQMPEMGGARVAEVIRHAGWTGPVVALTANAFSETREACLASWFDEYVIKPVRREVLVEVLGRLAPTAPMHA